MQRGIIGNAILSTWVIDMTIGEFFSGLLSLIWSDTNSLYIAPLNLSVRDIIVGLFALTIAAYIFSHMFNKTDGEGGEGERSKGGKGKRYQRKGK